MKNRLIEIAIKGIIILSVGIALNFKSCSTFAQGMVSKSRSTYIGLDVAFSKGPFRLGSDTSKINKMKCFGRRWQFGIIVNPPQIIKTGVPGLISMVVR